MIQHDVKIYHYFRCTTRKYAELFLKKGQIKLNTPKTWIEMEKAEGKGRGDILEGVYAKVHSRDIKSLINVSNLRKNGIGESKNSYTFFRDKLSIDQPCFCLYGLCNTSFKNTLFSNGKYANASIIPVLYFTDFYKYSTRDEIDSLNYTDRPVFMIIRSPEKFRRRFYDYFEKIGIPENEILLNQVKYVNKDEAFYIRCEKPHELFTKDYRFKDQSEFRLIINSSNKTALKKLRKRDFIIELGDMSDIVEINDYYLNDMIITIDEKMRIQYTLPNPKPQLLEDMSKEEILRALYFLHKRIGLEMYVVGETVDEKQKVNIAYFEKLLLEKYKIDYYVIVRHDIIVPDRNNPVIVKDPKPGIIP